MSTFVKSKSEDVPDIDFDDLEDILAQLTQEELEELNGDFDPDNSLLPPSQRQKDQTDKSPTGPYKRQKLLDFLEKKAKEEKDWEQNKPYVKETKGKVFVPKKIENKKEEQVNDDGTTDTEWDDILQQASEEELVDLAAVLGFHSMLTQTQYYASLEDRKIHEGGFTGAAHAQKFNPLPSEPPNTTDVEGSIEKLKNNDPELKSLNLNNIKNMSVERLEQLADALKDNTQLKKLEMAGVAANDKIARALAKALESNKTLKTLNVESNFLTGEAILTLLKAININQSVLHLHVANQKPEVLGNKVEMNIQKLILENDTMIRFGILFEFPGVRAKVTEKIQQNIDKLRKARIGGSS
ncbi:hypothetical protein LOTGIDRAFT_227355 [Lottia gigantea]|uniref:Tropomodulin n=1 Tax=Lottia gigantea TaxID=225164 RepID=V4AHL6_LOTGI|nr:hypothetical protein LOTGIDRAFT_227355 [Lottia gigantea]ESO94695.1 hypothetical protein LOTGIDRAFT_227355 [Lottia gigantea]